MLAPNLNRPPKTHPLLPARDLPSIHELRVLAEPQQLLHVEPSAAKIIPIEYHYGDDQNSAHCDRQCGDRH